MMLLQWKKFYQIMVFVRAKLLPNFIYQDFNPWAAASLPWVELFFSDVTVGLEGSLPEGGPPHPLGGWDPRTGNGSVVKSTMVIVFVLEGLGCVVPLPNDLYGWLINGGLYPNHLLVVG